jgi:hypothetical protein
MQLSSPSSVSKSVAAVAEAIPFDSASLEAITDVTLPDVGNVWEDASDFVADSAVVITEHGGRLVGRTARATWRNRSTVATIIITTLAVIGLVSLLKRNRTDDDPTTE